MMSVPELLSRIDEESGTIGIKREKLIIDPGFGFAKSYEHHCALLSQFEPPTDAWPTVDVWYFT